MKNVAAVLAIIGVCSGVLFALAPLFTGSGHVTAGSFLFPAGLGVLIVATHWLTLRRILAGPGKGFGLLLPNAILLVVILLAILFVPPAPGANARLSLGLVLMAALFLLPLACNVLYLALKRLPREALPHGG